MLRLRAAGNHARPFVKPVAEGIHPADTLRIGCAAALLTIFLAPIASCNSF